MVYLLTTVKSYKRLHDPLSVTDTQDRPKIELHMLTRITKLRLDLITVLTLLEMES